MFNPRERPRPITFLACLLVACLLLCGIASAAPSITLSKKSGPPTSRILVSGRGFNPNVGVDIYFDIKDEALVITNSKGEFDKAGIHAPRSARPGKHWVTALERNNDKGDQKPFLVQTDWPQDDFDNARTALNPYENVLDEKTVGGLDLDWTYQTGAQVFSSPAVVNGAVYFTSLDHNVYAVNADTGALIWKYTTGGEIWSSPTVVDGAVYLGSTDSYFYALNANTGALLWKVSTGNAYDIVFGSPAVTEDVVYAASRYHLYAWRAKSGSLLWSDEISGFSGPAVANGVAYLGSTDRFLYALNATTGSTQWRFDTGTNGGVGDPSVADGEVYFSFCDRTDNCYAAALNANTGGSLWQDPGLFSPSPAIGNGVIYVVSLKTLVAIDALTGNVLWTFDFGSIVYWSPSLANGVVYVASTGGNIYALSADAGRLLWTGTTGYAIYSSPSVANGRVYVGAYDGKLYAFSLKHLSSAGTSSLASPPDLSTLHANLDLQPLNE